MANANSSNAWSQNARGASSAAATLSQRKAAGVFYTPDSLVRYIVQQALSPLLAEQTAEVPPLRVLDPACGDGAFLVEVFRFLAAHEEGLSTNEDAAPLSTMAVERRLGIIRDHVFGVDIDRVAVAAAKRRLARLALGIDAAWTRGGASLGFLPVSASTPLSMSQVAGRSRFQPCCAGVLISVS